MPVDKFLYINSRMKIIDLMMSYFHIIVISSLHLSTTQHNTNDFSGSSAEDSMLTCVYYKRTKEEKTLVAHLK